MSLAPLRNATLATIAILGGAATLSLNKMYLPSTASKTQHIAAAMREDLDAINVHLGEDEAYAK